MNDFQNNEIIRAIIELEQPNRAPVTIQTTNDFILSVLEGRSGVFTLQPDPEKPNKSFITHNPRDVHFFSMKPKISSLKCSPLMKNSERYAVKFHDIDDFLTYRNELLQKPFMMQVDLKAMRKSGNTTYITKANVVATFNPKHENVMAMLSEAFDNAEESFKKNENFALEIRFIDIIYQWYKNALVQTTNERWAKPKYDKQSWELTLTNHTARLKFCNNCCCIVIGVYLFPLYLLTWASYKCYRKLSTKTYPVTITGHAVYRINTH